MATVSFCESNGLTFVHRGQTYKKLILSGWKLLISHVLILEASFGRHEDETMQVQYLDPSRVKTILGEL
jgi:uncharacterized membrane protein